MQIKNPYQLSNHEVIKKIISLSAAMSGVIGTNYIYFLTPTIYYINLYVFLDLYFAKRDMALHHLLVLSFFAAIKIHQFPIEYERNFTYQVVQFEYSTLFYSGGPLLLHYLSTQKRYNLDRWLPKIKTVLHIGFAITFIKYRIYNFAGNVIFRKSTYASDNFPGQMAFVHLIFTTWAFYALNLYWLQLIILKLVPSKKKPTQSIQYIDTR